MKNVKKMMFVLAMSAAALTAHAAVVTTLPGGTPLAIPAAEQLGDAGPETVAPGVTFTSTNGSAYGYTGGYSFVSNGNWSGTPMLGLDSTNGYMTLSFANAISGILGELNWAPGFGPAATVAIYDASNNLLESLSLSTASANLVNPGFYGFSRASNDIASIRFSNQYIGVRDISTTQAASDVPEPASLALVALGLTGFAFARKQAARK